MEPVSPGQDQDILSIYPEHASVTDGGELVVGGVGVRELAARFGTPAYIVDEEGLRQQAQRMRAGLAARHPDSEVLFASKSFPCAAAYRLFNDEGLGIDVAGAGEFLMARAADGGIRPLTDVNLPVSLCDVRCVADLTS